MSLNNFKKCLPIILESEGGYVNHPQDPGGATNMGITFKTLKDYRASIGLHSTTVDDVKGLAPHTVEAIYRKNYWDRVEGDNLPSGVDLVGFDGAVNSGVSRGAKWIQSAAGATADGKIGPKSLLAISLKDPEAIVKSACAKRMGFLKSLNTFSTFGRGWTARVIKVEVKGVAMAAEAKGRPVAEAMAQGQAEARQAATRLGQGATATTTTGAGTAALSDLSSYGLVLAMAGFAIVVAVLVIKAKNQKQRRAAYTEALEQADA